MVASPVSIMQINILESENNVKSKILLVQAFWIRDIQPVLANSSFVEDSTVIRERTL